MGGGWSATRARNHEDLFYSAYQRLETGVLFLHPSKRGYGVGRTALSPCLRGVHLYETSGEIGYTDLIMRSFKLHGIPVNLPSTKGEKIAVGVLLGFDAIVCLVIALVLLIK